MSGEDAANLAGTGIGLAILGMGAGVAMKSMYNVTDAASNSRRRRRKSSRRRSKR